MVGDMNTLRVLKVHRYSVLQVKSCHVLFIFLGIKRPFILVWTTIIFAGKYAMQSLSKKLYQ